MKLEYIVGIIVILFAVQFLYGVAANPDSEFGGADGAAEDVIASINPDYEPWFGGIGFEPPGGCLLYTSPSPRDRQKSRMPSSA